MAVQLFSAKQGIDPDKLFRPAETILSYLSDDEFMSAGEVCKTWHIARLSNQVHQLRVIINNVTSIESALTLLNEGDRCIIGNPKSLHKVHNVRVFLQTIDTTLAVYLKFLIGSASSVCGLTETYYVRAGERFTQLPVWKPIQYWTASMAIDQFKEELVETRAQYPSLKDLAQVQKTLVTRLAKAQA